MPESKEAGKEVGMGKSNIRRLGKGPLSSGWRLANKETGRWENIERQG